MSTKRLAMNGVRICANCAYWNGKSEPTDRTCLAYEYDMYDRATCSKTYVQTNAEQSCRKWSAK